MSDRPADAPVPPTLAYANTGGRRLGRNLRRIGLALFAVVALAAWRWHEPLGAFAEERYHDRQWRAAYARLAVGTPAPWGVADLGPPVYRDTRDVGPLETRKAPAAPHLAGDPDDLLALLGPHLEASDAAGAGVWVGTLPPLGDPGR